MKSKQKSAAKSRATDLCSYSWPNKDLAERETVKVRNSFKLNVSLYQLDFDQLQLKRVCLE